MAACAVDREGHDPAPLEPAPEHHVMLMLVGLVYRDPGYQREVVWPAHSYGVQQTLDCGIAAMFVVDVDRPKRIEITLTKPRVHHVEPSSIIAGPLMIAP